MAGSSTILRGTVRSNKANRQLKFIIGGVIVVALIAYLMVNAIQSAGTYYREVHEVLAQQTALTSKAIRVSGNIVSDSIVYDPAKLDLQFKISDPINANQRLAIHFHGVRPDQMSTEGSSAIVEGTLGTNGVVEANNLLLKCPSRYEQFQQINVQAVK
jgi:cytochrome c-type biogenesis protein CcmE